jgi:hypothetical protein
MFIQRRLYDPSNPDSPVSWRFSFLPQPIAIFDWQNEIVCFGEKRQAHRDKTEKRRQLPTTDGIYQTWIS